MTPEEFERLKEEEKRHLREMRALKQQYREARRKRGLLDALRGLTNPEAEATHEEMLDRLTRQNVESEARFEVALEDAGLDEDAAARRAREEADREAVRKAEAEALVRQMKQQMGDPSGGAASDEPSRAPGRTIGRVVPPEEGERPAEDARGAKTIGRQRQGE
ncbi:MAG TPA: hypothetical protein VK002_06155 [Rubricoccaceae bacterium]|nr:hypothetical protein [Rubricoccaceae bacterium]